MSTPGAVVGGGAVGRDTKGGRYSKICVFEIEGIGTKRMKRRCIGSEWNERWEC